MEIELAGARNAVLWAMRDRTHFYVKGTAHILEHMMAVTKVRDSY